MGRNLVEPNVEPFARFKRGIVDRAIFFLGDEVEGVAAVFAFAETVPDIPVSLDAELRGIAAVVNRTRTAEAVALAFEGVKHAIVLQHLFHRETFADGAKVHEWFSCFGHGIILFEGSAEIPKRAHARWNLVCLDFSTRERVFSSGRILQIELLWKP